MKYMSIVLTTMLVGTSAFAAPSSNDNAKGRIHRVAMQIERESVNGVAIAKQVFKRTLFDRLTDEEVRAVAELAFVQDAARESMPRSLRKTTPTTQCSRVTPICGCIAHSSSLKRIHSSARSPS